MRLLKFGFKLITKMFLLAVCLCEFAVIMLLLAKGHIPAWDDWPSVFSSQGDENARQVAKDIVDTCPRPERSYSRLLVLPVANDRNGMMETQIRHSLQQKADTGWYVPVEKTLSSKTLEVVQSISAPNDGQGEITSKKNAVRLGQLSNAEFVLCGIVDQFVPKEESHEIRCRFYLIEVANGNVVFESVFANRASENAGIFGQTDISRLLGRVAFVLLVVVACPVVFSPGFHLLVRLKNRLVCFFGLIAISVMPMCLAVRILEIPLPLLMQFGCHIAVFVVTAIWTAFLMDRVAAKTAIR